MEVWRNELYHHGIKGQKWGLRRFQNPDGTLTEAGKKRYYHTDPLGRDILNPRGITENEKRRRKFTRYKDSTIYNLQKASPEWAEAKARYLNANKENNQFYLKEREKWWNQEGEYKGKDYYTFKEIAANKWNETDTSKAEITALKDMERIATNTAKEHPLFNKTFTQFENISVSSLFGDPIKIKTLNYGEEVVKTIMNNTRLEAVMLQKHY